MPAPKGFRPPAAGKGRVAGTPNKITADLKAMILGALDDAGGRDYLVEQASANPTAFMALIGKVLPMQVAGDPNAPLKVEMTIAQKRAEALRAIDEAFREPDPK